MWDKIHLVALCFVMSNISLVRDTKRAALYLRELASVFGDLWLGKCTWIAKREFNGAMLTTRDMLSRTGL